MVYPHDDLVVSLRGRSILDELSATLQQHPDAVLVFCGAGFTSYPWLLPARTSVEVDLPHVVETKQEWTARLVAAGTIPDREVIPLALDLGEADAREQLVQRIEQISAGRPVVYVAEGMIYYLPPPDAAAVAELGQRLGAIRSLISYWPAEAADNQVLAAQRTWFRKHSVPEDATYFTFQELAARLGDGRQGWQVANLSLAEQQRRYLGEVRVPESELVPEHLAVASR